MYNLLSICLVLHPQYIDESIQQALKDKNLIDKIARMQSGDIAVSKKETKKLVSNFQIR